MTEIGTNMNERIQNVQLGCTSSTKFFFLILHNKCLNFGNLAWLKEPGQAKKKICESTEAKYNCKLIPGLKFGAFEKMKNS